MTKLKLESETCIYATFVSPSELTANYVPTISSAEALLLNIPL